MDYAIFRTGGKQYRAQPGDLIDVEKLPAEEGTRVELDEVLLVSRDGQLAVGQPLVPGARVVAQVQSHGRDAKITVFKYKRKTRYHVTRGHRQHYTRLAVQEILVEGEEGDGPQKGRRKRTQRTGQQAEATGRKAVRRPASPRRKHSSATTRDPGTTGS